MLRLQQRTLRLVVPRLCGLLLSAEPSLAFRIDSFPAFGLAAIKGGSMRPALASAEDVRRDSSIFRECVCTPRAQNPIKAAMKSGFQT
jgi:hypothetical protein